MHMSSYRHMQELAVKYLKEVNPGEVLDVGSQDINGSYRPIFEAMKWSYTGLDVCRGKNVDIVAPNHNLFPLENESFDLVISGQAFEHIEFFWQTFKEMVRVLRTGGMIFLIAPSRGPEHSYPQDCWRFYPDGYRSLAKWGNVELLHVSTDWQSSQEKDSSQWGDTIGVFIKKGGEGVSMGNMAFLTSINMGEAGRIVEPRSWVGHMLFAKWIVEQAQPLNFVELGTHTGNSYFAFCEAVKEAQLQTMCFAVDHWQGDDHSGFYSDEVYRHVDAYNQEHYSEFSHLLRMNFDDAVSKFEDGSIDLLHIDGYHTYEAVKHDFETWLPKLSDKAIVLFHDIEERKGDFGIWKFWEEICSRYPHFGFSHSSGLGVLGVGKNLPEPIRPLFAANDEEGFCSQVREFFARMNEVHISNALEQETRNVAQVFFDFGNGFSEEDSLSYEFVSAHMEFSVSLEQFGTLKRVRLDPGNDKCVVRLFGVEAKWLNGQKNQLKVLSHNAQGRFFNVFVFNSSDPRFEFEVNRAATELTFSYEIIGKNAAVSILALPQMESELQTARSKEGQTQNELEAMRQEADELRSERDRVREDLEQVLGQLEEADELRSERDRIRYQLGEMKGQLEGVRLELEAVRHEADAHAVSLNDLREERDTVMNSLTWRSARFFLDRVGRRIPGFNLFTGIAKRLDGWRQERKEIKFIKKSGLFDKDYYLGANPDVAQAKIGPIRHYVRHGWKEGRNPSRKFDTGFYLASNPDVAASGMNPLVHYALQGQGEGRQLKSQFDIYDYEVKFNLVENQTNYGLPIGVFIHLYYEELAEEIAGYIRNITYPFHVYISTTDEEKKHRIEQAFSAKGVTLVCKVLPNRGWDVAPIVVGFADEIRKYDICLRLHGKKSTHNPEEFGTQWRTYILDELVGSPERVKRIINNLVSRPDLGIIMPRHWDAVRNWIKIGENYEEMKNLLTSINIPLYPHQEINYPSGSMFWFKSKALSPLLDLNLQWEDFDRPDNGKRDGTIAHAIERSILYFAAIKGFKWSVIEEEQRLNVSPSEKPIVQIGDVYQAYQRPEESPSYESEETPQIPCTDIKFIAFYLPQFHPFEENERFWGKGFTEWTNTTKALPLFKGQYQPRLPGELGFYDTRIKDVIKRQIKLAKQYGIYGFCLHHYWFDGKPVMRVPYNHILENKDLDIPFCLHWANEPWTARFDGLSEKGGVLLAQKHGAEDDIAFFRDIEPALNDQRYIRIEGRPLLIIYRPSLFPDIRSSVERWRKCCSKAGLGDLYLAVMQTSFERPVDPRKYGFDTAIEFPPHNVRAVSVKSKVELFAPDFGGNIFSYPEMVEGALNRSVPGYTLFRTVLPDWDCTPRRNNPDIFIGSSPAMYQQWLEGICRYTKKNLPAGKRFIFINAWNEWAEGAYLEPDRRYGYAYLNATSRALVATHDVEQTLTEPIKKVAVVAHIYYTDLLEEFIRYFKNMPCNFDLYVSTTQDKEQDVRLKLQEHIPKEHLVVTGVENKGMDIGPFVVEFREKYHEYDLVCKVHSKKSTYNPEYAGWRGYLLDNLLGSRQTIEGILSKFEKNPHLGLLFPEPFPPVSDKLEWGSNRGTATKLLKRMGIDLTRDKHLVFPAGSMFWFRPKALSPLFNVGLTLDDFEDGSSHVVDQRTGEVIDGTLAHAVERTFIFLAENRNYEWEKVLYVPYNQEKKKTTLRSRHKWLKDYFKKENRYKKTVPGFCPACQKKTTFKSKHRWLRDHYRCKNCQSIPRERAIFHVMDTYFAGWEKGRLHEIAPANDYFARISVNYSCSQYYPDAKTGLVINGIRNENIEQLTFADNSLDFIVSLDVLEHIFDPRAALKEMVRVVRTGGSAVFTVPIHKDLEESRQRAKMNSDGQIEHFSPAEYHGNPVGDGRSLVTWDYGRDFVDKMHEWLEGIKVDIEIVNETKEEFGIEGEFLDVVIISKES